MRNLRCLLIFGLASIALAAGAAPRPLRNYAELTAALDRGESVRAVLHYARMTLEADGKTEAAPDAVGGMTFGSWERFAAGVVRNPLSYVSASETVLISHPRYGHVFNYVRLRVFEDGRVEATARYLRTGTYEVVMDETFRGRIEAGAPAAKPGEGGVRLFAAN